MGGSERAGRRVGGWPREPKASKRPAQEAADRVAQSNSAKRKQAERVQIVPAVGQERDREGGGI
jgi:hypothetical protein